MFYFRKENRLLKKNQFDYVFKQAKRIATPHFTFLYRHNEAKLSRLGLIISKKNLAKSHDRNFIKRIIRETFRHKVLPAIDIVVLARMGIKTTDRSRLHKELDDAWKKILDLNG